MQQVNGGPLDSTLQSVDTGVLATDRKIKAIGIQRQSITIAVPAGTDVQTGSMAMGVAGTLDSSIIATPIGILPAGIDYYPYIVDKNNYAINFRNNSGAAVALNAVVFNVTIFTGTP